MSNATIEIGHFVLCDKCSQGYVAYKRNHYDSNKLLLDTKGKPILVNGNYVSFGLISAFTMCDECKADTTKQARFDTSTQYMGEMKPDVYESEHPYKCYKEIMTYYSQKIGCVDLSAETLERFHLQFPTAFDKTNFYREAVLEIVRQEPPNVHIRSFFVSNLIKGEFNL